MTLEVPLWEFFLQKKLEGFPHRASFSIEKSLVGIFSRATKLRLREGQGRRMKMKKRKKKKRREKKEKKRKKKKRKEKNKKKSNFL